MIKKKSFWVGIAIGFFAGFLFAWFTVWATYMALEKQSRALATDLQQIKRIIFLKEDIAQERDTIIEWNREHIQPGPTEVVAEEEQ